ncbi:MAG TPA: nucleoside deaminase [Mycobacteriales bacterium]|jgi:cytosine deaminase|nr:nucleoside deaminase [Mycobacteriales bacterium]
MLSASDQRVLSLIVTEAQASLDVGAIPIAAALTRDDDLLGTGHNERVQRGDPIAHGEIACLRNAGRQASYAGTTLYTTLSPCQMCSGALLLFKIPRVVVGEAVTFPGDLQFLRDRGVEVELANDSRCVDLMTAFQQRYPAVWAEDIGEDV